MVEGSDASSAAVSTRLCAVVMSLATPIKLALVHGVTDGFHEVALLVRKFGNISRFNIGHQGRFTHGSLKSVSFSGGSPSFLNSMISTIPSDTLGCILEAPQFDKNYVPDYVLCRPIRSFIHMPGFTIPIFDFVVAELHANVQGSKEEPTCTLEIQVTLKQ
jgi:hypothetical protein